MNRLKIFGVLAIATLSITACEDITNPIEEFGQQESPYVRFASPTTATRAPGGTTVNAIITSPARVEENVTVQFTFGGTAVYGTDYRIVDAQGNARTGITANGGSVQLRYQFDNVSSPADTLRIQVPATANRGRTAEITIASATTASGRQLGTGFIDAFRKYILTIN
jgi:hypothetical protein